MCDILGAGRLLEPKYVHILGLYYARIKEDQIVIGRGVGTLPKVLGPRNKEVKDVFDILYDRTILFSDEVDGILSLDNP